MPRRPSADRATAEVTHEQTDNEAAPALAQAADPHDRVKKMAMKNAAEWRTAVKSSEREIKVEPKKEMNETQAARLCKP